MATWRNDDLADPQGRRLLFHAFAVDAPLSPQPPGRAPKQALVLQDRREGLVAIGLPRGARVEAGDDTALDFRAHDLTAELDRGSARVPRDEAGVRRVCGGCAVQTDSALSRERGSADRRARGPALAR
jgi:hypothetical protein